MQAPSQPRETVVRCLGAISFFPCFACWCSLASRGLRAPPDLPCRLFDFSFSDFLVGIFWSFLCSYLKDGVLARCWRTHPMPVASRNSAGWRLVRDAIPALNFPVSNALTNNCLTLPYVNLTGLKSPSRDRQTTKKWSISPSREWRSTKNMSKIM